jgi:hypothetical protein
MGVAAGRLRVLRRPPNAAHVELGAFEARPGGDRLRDRSQLRDSYCSLAWGKTLAAEAGAAVAAAVLKDDQEAALTARDRALAAWARKVVADPNGTTSSDIEALRSAGLDDRTIFEATAFAAFRLAFSTVNDALGANPDPELVDTAPMEVRSAVTYGRRPQAIGVKE